MDDSLIVQVAEGQYDLSSIEFDLLLWKPPVDLEEAVEVTALHVLHHEEQPKLWNIQLFHADYERVLTLW